MLKAIIVVLLASLVHGCVVYPSKNMDEPVVDGKINDYEVVKIGIDFGGTDTNSCKRLSTYYQVSESGDFYISAKHSWIKTRLLVPATCSQPFIVCAYTNDGKILSSAMSGETFPCNFDPPTIYINCYKEYGGFECK